MSCKTLNRLEVFKSKFRLLDRVKIPLLRLDDLVKHWFAQGRRMFLIELFSLLIGYCLYLIRHINIISRTISRAKFRARQKW